MALKASDVSRAFYQLVLDQDMLTRLGTAWFPGRRCFFMGFGTGKTSIAATIPAVYADSVWIPHAIVVDNQIVSVFDPGVHFPVPIEVSAESDRGGLCRRPCVLAGGDVGGMLDLQFSSTSRFIPRRCR